MGTRCLTVFKEANGTEICVLYRQFDGYPSGHGKELKDFLKGKKIVNGYNDDDEKNGNFNGMGCLVAQVIAHFKLGNNVDPKSGYKPSVIGGFYVFAAGVRDKWEEYIYFVSPKKLNLRDEKGRFTNRISVVPCIKAFNAAGRKVRI